MAIRVAILLIFAAPWLAGCASTAYRPLNPPNEQEAIVLIIRQRAEPTAWNLDVTVDGERAAAVSNNSHVKFSVPAGKRTIQFGWPKLAAKVNLERVLEFKGGETRYFLVSGTTRLTGASPVHQGMMLAFTETLQFVELSPSHGEQLLREMAGGS